MKNKGFLTIEFLISFLIGIIILSSFMKIIANTHKIFQYAFNYEKMRNQAVNTAVKIIKNQNAKTAKNTKITITKKKHPVYDEITIEKITIYSKNNHYEITIYKTK